MPSECLVVALILIMLIFGFLRAKRKNWAFAVLPLTVTPVLTGAIMYVAGDVMKISYSYTFPMSIIVGALAITCIWIGIASMTLIKTKKMRIPYVASTVAFSLAFSFLLLVQYQLALGFIL